MDIPSHKIMQIRTSTVTINEVDFTYLSIGSGSLIVCIHGFPDTAYSFIPVMRMLANQGYRVVAPFQRGYFPSGTAKDNNYSLLALAKDILDFISVLNEKKAIVIGHDWGSLAAQIAATIAPEKITKLVLVSIPPYPQLKFSAKQIKYFWYICFFQIPWLADKLLPIKNYAFLDWLYKSWSPGWSAYGDQLTLVKKSFATSGPSAALAYYRQLHKAPIKLMKNNLSVPTITIIGELDGCVDTLSITAGILRCSREFQYEVFPNVGHFPHCESPDQFFSVVLKFIAQEV